MRSRESRLRSSRSRGRGELRNRRRGHGQSEALSRSWESMLASDKRKGRSRSLCRSTEGKLACSRSRENWPASNDRSRSLCRSRERSLASNGLGGRLGYGQCRLVGAQELPAGRKSELTAYWSVIAVPL